MSIRCYLISSVLNTICVKFIVEELPDKISNQFVIIYLSSFYGFGLSAGVLGGVDVGLSCTPTNTTP